MLGIDGCRAGWLAVQYRSAESGEVVLAADLAGLWAELRPTGRVLIDMPIGLPDAETGPRACDRLARQLLGPRRASVFPVPGRAVLGATTYAEASALNAAVLGRKLSRQTWHLLPRIAELDRWLDGLPPAAWPREAHPELAFAALNRDVPLPHYKKTPEGQALRLGLLTVAWPAARELFEEGLARYPRRAVAPDDLLDALVLAWAAARPGILRSLPAEPVRDAAGRPMEIVWP